MILPRWVRGADALAIAALAVGLLVLVFGGFAVGSGVLRLSVRSPDRLLFAAAALIAIRHAAYPSSPLHRRVLRGLAAIRTDSPAALAAAAVASRMALLLVAYFAVVTIGFSKSQAGFEVSPDPLFNLPARFDAGWYGEIAQNGYYFQHRYDRQQNIAFFPAFPMLMRATGLLLGSHEPGVPQLWRKGRILWGGVLISIIAFAWAVVYFARLARELGLEARAPDAVALMAAYPFALFFSAPYTEGLFLLAAIATFYYFHRRQWVAASAWGILAGLTRPNGCLISVALAVLIVERLWETRQRSSEAGRYPIFPALAAAASPGIGMLTYSAFIWRLTGSWFAWAQLQQAWGRSYEGLAPVARGMSRIGSDGLLRAVAGVPYDTLNALGLIFALAMLWPVWRRLGAAWAVFIVVNVVPPMLAGGTLSMGRMTSTLFPLFLALAVILPRRAILPTVTAFALGQGLAAALFFTWRPLF